MSHIVNWGMLYLSGTGVGSVVAGTWFVVDMGYGGYNYFMGNGFTTISDKIDNMVEHTYGKFELYEGMY